ncbi:MAG: hypothetical protein HY743_07165 [Deltaproteobacteria bacterium]|nr:hypothetical protein [Deltaproteobacteria bacterium]
MPTKYFYRKIIFSCVLLFLLFSFITNFVDLEKLFLPKKYWEKQVISLQKNINLLEMLIRDKLLEIEKKDLTMDLDIQRSYNIFSQHGSFKINKDTMNNIIELHKIEKLKLQAEVEDLIDKINKLKNKLEKTQMELEKHS